MTSTQRQYNVNQDCVASERFTATQAIGAETRRARVEPGGGGFPGGRVTG